MNINSNIVRPGTMFRVVKPTKDSVFGIGTTGFIGYVKGQDQNFSNVVFYKVIIMRRGKGGKARLEPCEISVPIFLPESKSLKITFPKINRKYFVFIDTSLSLIPRSVLKFSNHLFLGWASSWGYFLNKLHTTVKRIKIWPNDSKHVLNTLLELPNKFAENPTYTLENYTAQEFRIKVVAEIRQFESILSGCAIDYLYKITCIEQKAFIDLLKNMESPESGEKKQLKEISNFITNKIVKLETSMQLRK